MLEGLYARQILTQLVFTKEIQYEANRLGMKSPMKVADPSSGIADRIQWRQSSEHGPVHATGAATLWHERAGI
jgi:hypothetical protein